METLRESCDSQIPPTEQLPERSTLTTDKITGLAWLNPTTLLTTGNAGTLKWWQLPLTAPQIFPGHTEAVAAIAISGDGKLLVSGGADKAVRLVDLSATTPAPKELTGQTGAVTAIALSSDKSLVVSGDDAGRVRFWNAADGADSLSLAGHTGAVTGVSVHPGGKQIATAGADGTVRVWDLPQPPVSIAGHTMPVTATAISGDGKLAATASGDKTVRLANLADGTAVRATAAHPDSVTAVTFRGDNLQLASGDATGAISLWNVADTEAQGVLHGHTGALTSLAYGPTGKQLFSTGADGTLRFWQVPQVKPVSFAGHTLGVQAVDLSADGSLAVLGGADGVVQIVDPAGTAAARVLAGQAGPVSAIELSADNTLVVSGSETGLLKLWNAADGADRLSLAGHADAVRDVSIRPDGKQVASASADGTIRIWNLPATPLPLTRAHDAHFQNCHESGRQTGCNGECRQNCPPFHGDRWQAGGGRTITCWCRVSFGNRLQCNRNSARQRRLRRRNPSVDDRRRKDADDSRWPHGGADGTGLRRDWKAALFHGSRRDTAHLDSAAGGSAIAGRPLPWRFRLSNSPPTEPSL